MKPTRREYIEGLRDRLVYGCCPYDEDFDCNQCNETLHDVFAVLEKWADAE